MDTEEEISCDAGVNHGLSVLISCARTYTRGTSGFAAEMQGLDIKVPEFPLFSPGRVIKAPIQLEEGAQILGALCGSCSPR